MRDGAQPPAEASMTSGEKQPYLGANVSPTVTAEIGYRGLLDDGEQLLAVFDGQLLDESQHRVGGLAMTDYLLLTDQRLITWARGLWTDMVDGFLWQDVELLDAECWDPYHGRLTICFHLPVPDSNRPPRRVSVRGPGRSAAEGGATAVLNLMDMMPAEDVPVATEMLQWVPEYLQEGHERPLADAFAETFPAVPRQPRPRLTPPAPQLPEPVEQPRKSWFFGGGKSDAGGATSARGLVSAYEQQRAGGPSGEPLNIPLRGGSIAPEQPTVYDISRGIRIVMQHRDKVGPVMGRLTRAMARMSEVVGGAADLVENMHDPDVRRVASAGLRQAMGQQGGAGTLGAIARASRRRDDGIGRQSERSSRRIEVRGPARSQSAADVEPISMRRSPVGQEAEPRVAMRSQAMPEIEVRTGVRPQGMPEIELRTNLRPLSGDDDESVPERAPLPDQIQRRVTVSRLEPLAGSGTGNVAEPTEPANERVSVPIRRVTRTQNSE